MKKKISRLCFTLVIGCNGANSEWVMRYSNPNPFKKLLSKFNPKPTDIWNTIRTQHLLNNYWIRIKSIIPKINTIHIQIWSQLICTTWVERKRKEIENYFLTFLETGLLRFVLKNGFPEMGCQTWIFITFP